MIEIKNLSFAYHDVPVLHDITLSVKKGDFVGLIGPNGSGKSTLLRILIHLLKTKKGEVLIDGRAIRSFSTAALAKIMALVPEENIAGFPFTVEELVLMGRAPHHPFCEPFSTRDQQITRTCLQETGIEQLAERPIHELSSGERQRAFIAQALVQQPTILLLDEPTAHLDINHQREIFDLLKARQQEQGLTIVSVTHDLNLAALYCDTLILLNNGRLFSHGLPEQVLTSSNLEVVYHTRVEVEQNRFTKRPYISLIPSKGRRNQ